VLCACVCGWVGGGGGGLCKVLLRNRRAASCSLCRFLTMCRKQNPAQEAATAMLAEWLEDSACNRNPYVRLVAGLVYAQEGNEVEALKALNGGGGATLEM
jgi:hypothetical protein